MGFPSLLWLGLVIAHLVSTEWGWNKKPGGGWSINWTTLPEASKLVENSCDVAARTATEDAANAIVHL